MNELAITWEPATAADFPIVYYLCFWSKLMVFNGKGQPTSAYQDYYLKLPYTAEMLERSREREAL